MGVIQAIPASQLGTEREMIWRRRGEGEEMRSETRRRRVEEERSLLQRSAGKMSRRGIRKGKEIQGSPQMVEGGESEREEKKGSTHLTQNGENGGYERDGESHFRCEGGEADGD